MRRMNWPRCGASSRQDYDHRRPTVSAQVFCVAWIESVRCAADGASLFGGTFSGAEAVDNDEALFLLIDEYFVEVGIPDEGEFENQRLQYFVREWTWPEEFVDFRSCFLEFC